MSISGFSVESLSKWMVLQIVLPLMARVWKDVTSVLFVDAMAGTGSYTDPELGTYYGSPVLLFNALRSMRSQQRRLLLVENDMTKFFELVEVMHKLKLPSDGGIDIIPSSSPCETALLPAVNSMSADRVLIFVDSNGFDMPDSLVELSKRKEVTLMLRWSDTALRRKNSGRMHDLVKQLQMPFWCYHDGMTRGIHKYKLLIGTHDRNVASVCQPVMEPLDIPTSVVYTSVSEAASPRVKRAKPALELVGVKSKQHSTKHIRLSPADMRTIKKMRKDGSTYDAIAAKMGCSLTTVVRRLRNPSSNVK